MVEGSRFTGDLRGRIRLGSVLAVSLVAVAVALTFWTGGCGSDHGGAPPSPSHVSLNTNNQPLWVANGTNVLEFAGPYTSHTPNIAPVTTLDTTADFASAQGVQFDDSGDLWVIDQGTSTAAASLNEFTAAQIAPGGTLTLTPAVTITSPSLSLPKQGVFDSTGNLWVTNNTLPTDRAGVLKFSAAQLATSGAKVPIAAIESTAFVGGPLGIAFDSTGNLWVSNNGNNTIMEFAAASLPTTGAVTINTPTVLLSATASSIDGPWGLEFDSAGDLWSSNKTASTVVAFAASSIGANGSPMPAVTLSSVDVGKSKVPSLNSPEGIDFDGVGDLAVANQGTPVGPTPSPSPSASPTATATASPSPTASPTATASASPSPTPVASVASIAIFAAKQLTKSGAVAPQVLISGSDTLLTAPAGVVFGPSAATPTPTSSPSSSPTSSASPTSSPSPTPTSTPTA